MTHTPSPWTRPPSGTSSLVDYTKMGGKALCIAAGVTLSGENQSFKFATPILYPSLLGVSKEAITIPSSTLAKLEGAAGKEIIAFFITRNMAFVAYDNGEGCSVIFGGLDQLLTTELFDKVKEWPTLG